ncbi:hypothetical protein TNCV_3732351 [Trichonephila clavipes]|nr:hypothetical protein TNCV_3732351 [Trichonephila clavipes]
MDIVKSFDCLLTRTLKSCERPIGDGTRSFESRLSDKAVTGELKLHSPNFRTTPIPPCPNHYSRHSPSGEGTPTRQRRTSIQSTRPSVKYVRLSTLSNGSNCPASRVRRLFRVRPLGSLCDGEKKGGCEQGKGHVKSHGGKSTATSVIAHQTEKEWISTNEKNRKRMAQTYAEGSAEKHAARLEDAHH